MPDIASVLADNGGANIGNMMGLAKAAQTPDYATQMEGTLNLANLMDQRRQAMAAKGILCQPTAYDKDSNLTPFAHAQLSGVSPQMAENISNAEAMRQYRESMGQGAENRATAMLKTADIAQQKLDYKKDTQRQIDDNNIAANLINNATPETIGPALDTYAALHHGMFHAPGDIADWNEKLGRTPVLDANGQPTGQWQGTVTPEKLDALKTGVYAVANTFQQNKLNEIKERGQDAKDFQTYTINLKAETEKERANRANEAIKLQMAKYKEVQSAARERRMSAQLGGKMTDAEKSMLGDVKTELTGRGTIGIQSKKIDAAIDTRAALNRYYDPKTGEYQVPSSGYEELVTSLASMLSVSGGGSGGSEAQRKGLQQATAEGDLNKFLSYWTGAPKNATSQEMLKIAANQIDAVGLQSEQNRNGYFPNIEKKYVGLGVNPARAKTIAQHAGNSYADFLRGAYEDLGFFMDDRTLNSLYQTQQGVGPGRAQKRAIGGAPATGPVGPGSTAPAAGPGSAAPAAVVSDMDALNKLFPPKTGTK